MTDLEKLREAAAEREYQLYEFGCPVEDSMGWEWTTPGNEMTSRLFLRNDEGGDSIPAHINVSFREESDEVTEVTAYITKTGAIVGKRGVERAPSPAI